MLSKYKEFMDSLVSKIKKNGSGHSVILTTQDNGYILEVFSRTAFDGLAESLFMTASDQGMTVCLEENLCASDHSLKKFGLKILMIIHRRLLRKPQNLPSLICQDLIFKK